MNKRDIKTAAELEIALADAMKNKSSISIDIFNSSRDMIKLVTTISLISDGANYIICCSASNLTGATSYADKLDALHITAFVKGVFNKHKLIFMDGLSCSLNEW